MRQLWLWEVKKFFHSYLHRILVVFLLLTPILVAGFFWLDGQREEQMGLSKQQRMAQQDAMRFKQQGVVDEQWLLQMQQELAELESSQMGMETLRYQMLQEDIQRASNTYEGKQAMLEAKDTPASIKEDLRTHELVYGPNEGWKCLYTMLELCGIAYILVMTFLFCDLFNQETSTQLIDVLKSCRYGRKQLAFAKLSMMLVITLGIGIVMVVCLLLTANLLYDFSISPTAMQKMGVQVFTYQELLPQAIALFLMGGLISALLSTLCSSLLQKGTYSLLMGAVFYGLPNIVTIPILGIAWQLFLPSLFIHYASFQQLLMAPWLGFTSTCIFPRAITIGIVWCVLAIVALAWSDYHYCKNTSKWMRKWERLWN